jgi:hypothetical protein
VKDLEPTSIAGFDGFAFSLPRNVSKGLHNGKKDVKSVGVAALCRSMPLFISSF